MDDRLELDCKKKKRDMTENRKLWSRRESTKLSCERIAVRKKFIPCEGIER